MASAPSRRASNFATLGAEVDRVNSVDVASDAARLRAYIEKAGQSGRERLPPEPRLSEELKITRGRLRTILKRLEEEGLIWRHVGRGTFVGPRRVELNSPELSEGVSVADMMEARIVLEPGLAAQAAVHAKPSEMRALDRCLADMEKASTYAEWKRLDDKLHRTIAAAAHNTLLLLIYDTMSAQIRAQLEPRQEQVFGHESPPVHPGRQHREVVEAIRAHDPDAASRRMREHLVHVRTALFGRP
jgi:DNA-binding FadR family transcriptional regulator